MATPLFAFEVEHPDGDQLVVSEPRVLHGVLGAVLAAVVISLFHSETLSSLNVVGVGLGLILVWFSFQSLFIAIAGRSFCFDKTEALVLRNGRRLCSFAEIKSVDVAVRFRPLVNPFYSKYTLFLQLKSGAEIAIAAVTVETFWQFLLSSHDSLPFPDEDHGELHQIADEIGAMASVRVTKRRK